MKYKFIINSRTGNGTGIRDIAEMQEYFTNAIGSFDYVLPGSRKEAVQMTRAFLKGGIERIVAVGGDGTANTIVNGFFEDGEPINSEGELVVACAGSGCDYYCSVTKQKRPKSWMELAANCDPRFVDVGHIRFEDPSLTDRYFVNMASVGMIAYISEKKEKASKLVPTALRYVVPSLQALFSYEPHELKITTDDAQFTVDALAVSISKGSFAGGGMKFGLDVALDDGLFEVTIIKKSTSIKLAAKFVKIFIGNYRNEKEIEKLMTRRIDIKSKRPIPCEFDGEIYGATNVSVRVLPKAVKVCFPQ